MNLQAASRDFALRVAQSAFLCVTAIATPELMGQQLHMLALETELVPSQRNMDGPCFGDMPRANQDCGALIPTVSWPAGKTDLKAQSGLLLRPSHARTRISAKCYPSSTLLELSTYYLGPMLVFAQK